MDTAPSRPRPGIAAVLALLCGGLGHAYAGRLLTGVALHLASLAAWMALTLALRLGLGWAVAVGTGAFGLWVAQAALAARAVRTAGEARAWWARPLGLAALYGVSLVSSGGLRSLLEARVVRTFVMPAGSMIPTLRPGDWIVVAPGAPIERGAVVVHQAPPSSPGKADPIVKRVVALGGDTVEVRDGRPVLNGEPVPHERLEAPCVYESRPEGQVWHFEPCVDIVERLGSHAYHVYCTPFLPCGDVAPLGVPQGQVFVLGDHRDHSVDSRVYGPIPAQAIVGRASYIYFSLGPSGIRWNRIGRAVR